MELQKGRPSDEIGRLSKEIRVYDFLDKLNVEYYRIDHEPAYTMEVCQEIDKSLEATICKNLFLCNRQKTDFYLLLIPGDKVFKTWNCLIRLGQPDFLLESLHLWKSFWTLHRGQPVYWV